MIAFITAELVWAAGNKTPKFFHQFIGGGNDVVNVFALSGITDKLMR